MDDGRHTRQGCARGQSHGTLDREDPDIGNGAMWAATSYSAMKDQGRVPFPASRAKLKTISGTGCWCGASPVHSGPHLQPLPWESRERAESEATDKLTDALVRVSFVAGAQGVGIAVLCVKGVPKYVAPCKEVPVGEVKWFGSVPHIEREL